MPVALSEFLAGKFCDHVQWAYEMWQTAKAIFDPKHHPALEDNRWKTFFYRIFHISLYTYVMEIEKFHDKAVTSGKITFSLEYVYLFGGWDEATKDSLQKLRDKMEQFHQRMSPLRNKILAHRDLEALIAEKPLGEHDPGMDVQYFADLREFAGIVYSKVTGKRWVWAEDAWTDADCFMDELTRKGVLSKPKP